MANDVAWRVRWDAGEIVVHQPTEQAAINVGIEYLRVIEARRIVAELCSPRVEEWDGLGGIEGRAKGAGA
jgi:hypothetical protein